MAWQNSPNFEWIEGGDIFSEPFLEKLFHNEFIDPLLNYPEDQAVSSISRADFQDLDDRSFVITQGFGALYFSDEDPDEAARGVADEIYNVGWHPLIAERIANLLQQDMSLFKATHLRRGDLLTEPYRHVHFPGKYVSRSLYLQKMRDDMVANPEQRWIVFSDDPTAAPWFAQRIPHVYTPAQMVDFTGLNSLQRDLVELVLMSRCSAVVAPTSSAYSQTALAIGTGRAEDISLAYPVDLQRRLMAEMLLTLLTTPEPAPDLEREAQAYAILTEQVGEIHAAIDLLEDVNRRRPPNAVTLFMLGRLHRHTRAYDRALLHVNAAMQTLVKVEAEHPIISGYTAFGETMHLVAIIAESYLENQPLNDDTTGTRAALRQNGIEMCDRALYRHPGAEHIRATRGRLTVLT